MSDLQRQIQNRIDQIDAQYDGKVADKQATLVIMDAIKNRDPSRLSNYRGDIFHKNDAKAQNLLRTIYNEIEKTFGERIRSERADVIESTKKETGKIRTLFQTRKQLSDVQVEEKALSNLERANQFKYINTELNKAFTKDLQGHFIEGGLLGMLNNPNTALKKAINNIEKKYGTAMAQEVRRALVEISRNAETAQAILNQDKSQVRKVGEWFASIFGYQRGGQITKYWQTNPDFQGYMRRNLMKNLLSGGLAILGFAYSWVIYGGMMKVPLKIQSVGTPNKNLVARALYGNGSSARDIVQGSIDEIDSYIARGMRNGVRGPAAEKMQKGIAQGIDIDATRVEHDINQANSTLWEYIDRIPLLGLVFDDERRLRKDMQEYARIMENTNPSEPERARAIYLNARISNKLNAARARMGKKKPNNNRDVARQTIDDVIAGTRQVVAVEALREGNKLKAFLNSHRGYADVEGKLPTRDPIVRQAFQAYFSGQSFNGYKWDALLNYIWKDPSIPGVQAMVRAYTTGNSTHRQKYMRTYCSGDFEGRTISTVGSKWGENISNIIQDPLAVQNYIASHRNKANGLPLAAWYASKLDQLTSGMLIVSPGAILNAIKNGQYNPNFSGQNTGVSTWALTEKYNYNNKPVLECRVPATIDGIRGILTIGIKPDCANLVIGEFSSNYNANNPDANILLRVPLFWSVKRGHSVEKKSNKPQEPKKPGKVEGNSTPNTPNYQSSGNSLPNTGTINTPPTTPTEIPVDSGETITSSVTTAPASGLSAGWVTIPANAGVGAVPPGPL